MPMLDPQDLVDNIAVVCKEDEAGGIFIESPDWKNPSGMANLSNDVPPYVQFGGRRDADSGKRR